MRAAVKNADDLTISFDRHARDGSFGRNFEELNPHLAREFTATRREPFLKLGVQIVENSHANVLPSMALGRLTP